MHFYYIAQPARWIGTGARPTFPHVVLTAHNKWLRTWVLKYLSWKWFHYHLSWMHPLRQGLTGLSRLLQVTGLHSRRQRLCGPPSLSWTPSQPYIINGVICPESHTNEQIHQSSYALLWSHSMFVFFFNPVLSHMPIKYFIAFSSIYMLVFQICFCSSLPTVWPSVV